MTRKKKRWLVGVALGVVVVGATVAFASRSKGPSATKDETPIGKVAIANVQVEVTEIGTVEPEVKVDVKDVGTQLNSVPTVTSDKAGRLSLEVPLDSTKAATTDAAKIVIPLKPAQSRLER